MLLQVLYGAYVIKSDQPNHLYLHYYRCLVDAEFAVPFFAHAVIEKVSRLEVSLMSHIIRRQLTGFVRVDCIIEHPVLITSNQVFELQYFMDDPFVGHVWPSCTCIEEYHIE